MGHWTSAWQSKLVPLEIWSGYSRGRNRQQLAELTGVSRRILQPRQHR